MFLMETSKANDLGVVWESWERRGIKTSSGSTGVHHVVSRSTQFGKLHTTQIHTMNVSSYVFHFYKSILRNLGFLCNNLVTKRKCAFMELSLFLCGLYAHASTERQTHREADIDRERDQREYFCLPQLCAPQSPRVLTPKMAVSKANFKFACCSFVLYCSYIFTSKDLEHFAKLLCMVKYYNKCYLQFKSIRK